MSNDIKAIVDALAAEAGFGPLARADLAPELQALVLAVAARCVEFCRDEAANRLEGSLTFPLEKNPPYIRGQYRAATACAVRLEEEFGIAQHGGPNG
ncbi:MAG: hypothetical protein EOP35_06100 [Rubrivivax sp.]|nr:MAG: hypothetical protein EOP35_06100 [Rubrivivax sp.]